MRRRSPGFVYLQLQRRVVPLASVGEWFRWQLARLRTAGLGGALEALEAPRSFMCAHRRAVPG